MRCLKRFIVQHTPWAACVATGVVLGASPVVAAAEAAESPFLIGMASGVGVGTIQVDQSSSDPESLVFGVKKKKTYKVGGFPASVFIYRPVKRWLTIGYGASVIFDLANRQILATAGETQFAWHFLGGSPHLATGEKSLSIVHHSPLNLSAVLGIRGANYSSLVRGAEFKGIAIETRLGLEFRHDLTEWWSAGGSLSSTAFALAATSPGITPKFSEATLFVRYTP